MARGFSSVSLKFNNSQSGAATQKSLPQPQFSMPDFRHMKVGKIPIHSPRLVRPKTYFSLSLKKSKNHLILPSPFVEETFLKIDDDSPL